MSEQGTAKSYKVFVRNWWRWERSTTSKVKVPDPGARKTTIATRCTYEEALRICQEYAKTHNPGPLSRKAEFTEEG
jgi:hypothetical protein